MSPVPVRSPETQARLEMIKRTVVSLKITLFTVTPKRIVSFMFSVISFNSSNVYQVVSLLSLLQQLHLSR